MELLNQKEIQEQKSEILDEAKQRADKLRDEENRLVLQINVARENSENEIKKINEDLEEYKKAKATEKVTLNKEINKLQNERKKLLKPIDKIKKEAEILLAEARTDKIEVKKQKEDLEKDREKLQEIAEANRDQMQSLDEKEEKIIENEKCVIIEQDDSKKSIERAKDEWIKVTNAITKLNDKTLELNEIESKLNTIKKTLDIRSEEQDKTDITLYNREKTLRSNYKALEQAKEHLGIK